MKAKKLIHLRKIREDQELYHYTKCSGVQGIISQKTFFATDSSFLNDSNEFDYIWTVIKSILDEISNPNWREELKRAFAVNEESDHYRKSKEYYVLSFSTCADSITLWAEFGDTTGYNIGLSSKSILNSISRENMLVYDGYVIYDFTEQKQILRELLIHVIPGELSCSFEDIMREGQKTPVLFEKFCAAFRKAVSIYAMFFKQEEFKEEHEYRFVFKSEKKKEVFFREKDGFLLPYLKISVDGDGADEKLPIKSVMVAPKNHIDLAQKGMQRYMSYYGYEVPVKLSNIKLRY